MIGIIFLILASITVFSSIKLSIYADNLSKTSKISGAIIGGILLAGITSLPELVTCLSSIFMGNSSLAMGDVIGSNLFNIFIICVFDVIYFRKMIFNKTNNSHVKVFILLIIDYLFIFLYLNNTFSYALFNIGIPTLVILCLYIFYIITIKKENSVADVSVKKINHLGIKIVITSICMIISSSLLTFVVNEISVIYSMFSSSVLGAILLGVTTSLPEVVTFYTLILVNNYDMAVDDIIGSNLFNLFVLAIGDLVLFGSSIFDARDGNSYLIFLCCFIFSIVNMFQNIRKKSISKLTYLIPSIFLIFLYLLLWIYSFV